MKDTVHVTLVLWRPDWPTVEWTLRSLADQTAALELHVLVNEDPGGADARRMRELTQQSGVPCHSVTSTGENRGFAGGHNALLAEVFAAGAATAVVLNPDVSLTPDALENLVGFEPASSQAWIAGPLLELANATTLQGEQRIDTAGITWTRTARHLDDMQGKALASAPSQPRQVAGISGACMLVTRSAYTIVLTETDEFFDEDFIAYREDAELCLRATQLGVDCWLVPGARGLHVRSLRGTTRGAISAVDRLGVRNRFLIAFKHGCRRPGGRHGALVRDVVVIAGVLVRERSSLPGLRDAWQLRHRMREKRRRIRAARIRTAAQARR
ncbi:MAG: hypothetical protein QOG53_896 [Frankiales bacterium]|nr:hypothetical protein [Frankiales bacterium]